MVQKQRSAILPKTGEDLARSEMVVGTKNLDGLNSKEAAL
jgi:hypothetical protein